MAKLNFNPQGYVFQDGLSRIRQSYESASAAVYADLERAKEEAVAYQQELDEGGEWKGERDDEGYVLWDHSTVLEMNIGNAREALLALETAFLVIAYHHWERSALIWTGLIQETHDKLAAKVIALGYPIDPRLGELRDLANTIKHNNDKWGEKLLAHRPDLLTISSKNPKWKTNWYAKLNLSQKTVDEFFAIVARSGPHTRMVFS